MGAAILSLVANNGYGVKRKDQIALSVAER